MADSETSSGSARSDEGVHDEVARIQQQWRDLLEHEASAAVAKGERPPCTDPAQIAFELGVMLAGTNIVSVLHDDLAVVARARPAEESTVRQHAGLASLVAEVASITC
jgi:hypothetical protein